MGNLILKERASSLASAKALLFTLVMAGFAALWTVLASPAFAQEPPADTPAMKQVGPYRMAVVTTTLQPVQQIARYYVYLQDDVTGQPVPEAQVRIRTTNETTGEQGWAFALNTPQQPTIYTANVQFDQQGVWDGVVEIASTLGTVDMPLDAPVVVHAATSSSAGGYVFLVTTLVLISGGLYVTWRIRQAQSRLRRDQASSDGTPLSIASH